jgi:hypothetical protein
MLVEYTLVAIIEATRLVEHFLEKTAVATGGDKCPFCTQQPLLDSMMTHSWACELNARKQLTADLNIDRLRNDVAQRPHAVDRAEAREDDNAPPRLVV